MDSTTYLKDVPDARCQPRQETIRFLLDYSKSLNVVTLASGQQFEMIRN